MNTSRIGLAGGAFMILSAVLTDLSQVLLVLIPFIGWVFALAVTFIASLIFGIWFSHEEVSMMDPQRVLGFLGTMTGELIPFVDGVPFWTSLVTYTVIKEWRTPDAI